MKFYVGLGGENDAMYCAGDHLVNNFEYNHHEAFPTILSPNLCLTETVIFGN